MTGYGTIESAVEAIRLGAFDYLTKPIIDDELNFSIQRALGQRQIVEENKTLQGAARPAVRPGEHHRPRLQDAQDVRPDRERRRHADDRPDPRRKRHRQDDDRPRHPPAELAPRQAVRRSRLRRTARHAAGKRTVRPRGRQLHRRHSRQDRQVPAGRRRHDLPRRNRHRLAQPAGQTAARPARPRIRSRSAATRRTRSTSA